MRRYRREYLLLLPVVGILGQDAWWKPGPGVNWDVRKAAVFLSMHHGFFVFFFSRKLSHFTERWVCRVPRERAAPFPLSTTNRPICRILLSRVRGRQQFSVLALCGMCGYRKPQAKKAVGNLDLSCVCSLVFQKILASCCMCNRGSMPLPATLGLSALCTACLLPNTA